MPIRTDTKAVRGCPGSLSPGTTGDVYDSDLCYDCGSQGGLAHNNIVTCDMTVRYLYVYLGEYGEPLGLAEISAYAEITIGYEGNPLGTTP